MRFFVLMLAAVLTVACQSREPEPQPKDPLVARGQKLFEGRGNCTSCHKPDKKIIGPSLVEIAKVYREKQGDLVAFLREEAPAIVDPHQYEAMRINLRLTKKMSQDELNALEAYIMSF